MNTYQIVAGATSSVSDGTTTTANGATIIIGGSVDPLKHALLRFDTSAITAIEVVVSAKFSALVSSVTGVLRPDISLWASNFGAAVANADWNLAESNVSGATFRKKIGKAFEGDSVAANTFCRMEVPSYYITPAGNTDLELRPDAVATGTVLIHGAGATGAIVFNSDDTAILSGQKPTLDIVTLTAAEEISQTSYRPHVVGAESYVGFDVETTPGTPVKAKYLLDVLSTDLDIDAGNLVSQALRRERAKPNKIVIGSAGGGGSFGFEFTPENMWLLLTGFLKWTAVSSTLSTTVTTGAATAIQTVGSTTGMVAGERVWFATSRQGGTILTVDSGVQITLTAALTTSTFTGETVNYGVFTNTFKVAQSDEVKTFTFVKGEGVSYREVYCGCMLSTLSINASYGNIITGSCSLEGRRVFRYDSNASGGDGDPYILSETAGYDTNLNLSFVGAEIEFDDTANRGTIPNMTINLNNSIQPIVGLRRRRDITGHYPQAFTVDISFDLEFENDAQYRKFIGVNHSKYPHLPETSIMTQKVELKLGGPDGYATQEVIFEVPKMLFTTVRKPIGGDGTVMLSCSGMATFDSVSNSNLVVYTKNTQDPGFYIASTDTVSVIPPDVTFP